MVGPHVGSLLHRIFQPTSVDSSSFRLYLQIASQAPSQEKLIPSLKNLCNHLLQKFHQSSLLSLSAMEKHLPNCTNLIPFIILFFCCYLKPISSSFTPSTNYLILCGSNNSTKIEGRDFLGDDNSSNAVRLSTDSRISVKDPTPDSSSALNHTARVFTSSSSYEFDIESQGKHTVRFHFYPFYNQNYNLSSAVFDVSALQFSLLRNFSIPNKTYISKEYIININESKLGIKFTPSGTSTRPLAFVNALEVFSLPDSLISDSAKLVPPKEAPKFEGLSAQGLEVLYHINVGGPKITSLTDTLWRTWIPDDDYLLLPNSAIPIDTSAPIAYYEDGSSREAAPDSVYNTARKMKKLGMVSQNFNITWNFSVPTGFQYLVRFHFCDIISNSSSAAEQLSFNAYINTASAATDINPYSITLQRLMAPFYRDYVAVPTSSGLLRVSVGPGSSTTNNPSKANAILNGLEIMKINNSAGSFDGVIAVNSSSKRRDNKISVAILIGSIAGGIVIIGLLASALLMMFRRRRLPKQKPEETGPRWSSSPIGVNSDRSGTGSIDRMQLNPSLNLNLGLQISFADIKLATNNFSENSVIGAGGFGKVYKGELQDGTKVAVKRGGAPGSHQGLPEFQTEIMLLSRIRHRHLVSLIGYCEEQNEMILVNEYMEKGPLKQHLYGSNLPCLSWNQRLQICIGAARGIHYLHTGWSQGIIHRDVKSSNILLDENYLAKMADFGLSKLGPSFDETHVSTVVKGSFGYLDPEYFKRHQLTDKSDIYSFGVVLLEVLCARPVIDSSLSREKQNLAEWAMLMNRKGLLKEIVDPRIAGQINANSLRKYWETAEKCLAEYGVDRPAIGDVLWDCEYALQLQESVLQREAYEDSGTQASEMSLPIVRLAPSASVRVEEEESTETSDQSEVTTSKVFSQLIINDGR